MPSGSLVRPNPTNLASLRRRPPRPRGPETARCPALESWPPRRDTAAPGRRPATAWWAWWWTAALRRWGSSRGERRLSEWDMNSMRTSCLIVSHVRHDSELYFSKELFVYGYFSWVWIWFMLVLSFLFCFLSLSCFLSLWWSSPVSPEFRPPSSSSRASLRLRQFVLSRSLQPVS